MSAQTAAHVSLRGLSAEDRPLLERIYASTRADELALVTWSEDEKDAFLHQQFEAQDAYYRQWYADCSFQMVLVDAVPAGRLYVRRTANEIRVVDIALLPEHRGQRVGSHLLGELLEESRQERKPLTIHVERFNRALGLYRRLGFRTLEDRGVYLLLEARPYEDDE